MKWWNGMIIIPDSPSIARMFVAFKEMEWEAPRINMVFSPQEGDCNKHEIESIDNGYIWIYHVQTPFHQTSQAYINPPSQTYQNKGIKATKTGRTVLDTSCCILKRKFLRWISSNNIEHHDLVMCMGTDQVVNGVPIDSKSTVVTKFNTKAYVLHVWSDHFFGGLRNFDPFDPSPGMDRSGVYHPYWNMLNQALKMAFR